MGNNPEKRWTHDGDAMVRDIPEERDDRAGRILTYYDAASHTYDSQASPLPVGGHVR